MSLRAPPDGAHMPLSDADAPRVLWRVTTGTGHVVEAVLSVVGGQHTVVIRQEGEALDSRSFDDAGRALDWAESVLLGRDDA